MSVVEIGCGVGNAVLPLIEQHAKLARQNPRLVVHCLDFAPSAIDLLKNDTRFCEPHTAHVYDVSSMHPSTINLDCGRTSSTLAGSADVAILLFCLSAIGPHPSPPLARAAQNVIDMLKPGGVLLMRDYGRLDEGESFMQWCRLCMGVCQSQRNQTICSSTEAWKGGQRSWT